VERLDRQGFATRLDDAERAWLDLDTAAFRDRVNVLTGLVVPCLGDLVPPDLSARWHRVMALHLDTLGASEGADGSISAAHTLDAGLVFDDAWVGEDHHLRAAFASAQADGTRRVPEPRSGTLAFDGTPGRDRPANQPTLVQVFDAAGVARTTAYLGARDPLPAYEAIPKVRNRLLVGTGLSLLATGVTLGLAYSAQGELFSLAEDQQVPGPELEAQRRRADGLAAVSYGLVGLTAGLGGAALAVGQR
jgi:hypothetical protein